MRNKKYKGRHMRRVHPKYFSTLILILFLTTICGSTSYLMKKNSANNEFVMGEVSPTIVESFNSANKVKKDVKVKNDGNVPIYVRTSIVITWKDDEGRILESSPKENKDYEISFSTSENWIKSEEGYYYYKKPLGVDEDTDVLIEECTQIKEYEDRILEVSIITQGIQAEPSKAVKEAWDVDVIDNYIDIGGE